MLGNLSKRGGPIPFLRIFGRLNPHYLTSLLFHNFILIVEITESFHALIWSLLYLSSGFRRGKKFIGSCDAYLFVNLSDSSPILLYPVDQGACSSLTDIFKEDRLFVVLVSIYVYYSKVRSFLLSVEGIGSPEPTT